MGRAVIVGGSLGGLNAALWLRDVGWDVEVLERSASPLEGRGAGIVLHPAAARYLVEHDVAALTEISAPVDWLRYLAADGTVASETPCRFRFTSWTTLYRSLLGCLDRSCYRMGQEVVAIEPGEREAAVVTAGGERLTADLVVAADGVASTVRSLLMPDVEPRYAGYVGWRGTVGEEQLSPETFRALHEAITYHLRPASHILAYPIPNVDGTVTAGRRQFNWVWYRNVADGAPLDDLMIGVDGRRHSLSLPPGLVRPEHVDEVRAATAELPGPLAEIVTRTAEPFVQLIADVAVARMVVGRVCILGDAAFALRPHAAVGTAKAAEDAWQLARALEDTGGDVDGALAAWETAQLRLGARVSVRTREAGNRAQFAGTWRVGEPLPFGLYEEGDSAFDAPHGAPSSNQMPLPPEG
ncbi:MAG TPA: FAD binding domain-containing protein [Acidimicrobiia bacterium]|nr:FAD binding domain-containing protein [Acidimicrobiia bacterium]